MTDEVQDALMSEKISERHARSLLSLSNPQDQIDMLNKIIENRLTVRQLDNEIKKLNEPAPEEPTSRFNILNNEENKDLLNQIETLDMSFSDNEDNTDLESEDIAKLIMDSKKQLQNQYEIFDIPTAEESKPVETKVEEPKETKPQKRIVKGDLNSVINSLKDIEQEISDAGFQIETEDYDFEDLYQIIIKIEK